MSYTKIKEILYSTIGLHAESVGKSSVDRAINQRMEATKCESAVQYLKLVKNDISELDELIEEVVVPETWFFRNRAPFDYLKNNALSIFRGFYGGNGKDTNEKDVDCEKDCLRVLSIPCSTGEEAYSIAISLRESGLGMSDFHVEAFDISKRALLKAKRGIYGKHSFRENGIDYKDQYFEKIKTGIRLSADIRERVCFNRANLLHDNISPHPYYYDIIFCRNVLIYFDRKTQKSILEKLANILKPGGILFVGHAEAGQVDNEAFSKIHVPKAFAYRKMPATVSENSAFIGSSDPSVNKLKDIYDQLVEVTRKDTELASKINKKIKNKSRNKKRKINTNPEKPGEGAIKNIAEGKDQDETAMVNEASLLINNGRFNDAERLCEKFLEINPESADAYYLLGLISNLKGGYGGAESLLRKAIYLSPDHYKALALSAVLAEKRGDLSSADILRRREKKARGRNS